MRVEVTKQTKINGVKCYPGDIVEVKNLSKLRHVAKEINFEKPMEMVSVKNELGIVVLLSGNTKTFRRLQDWLRLCTKPTCSLYILDSSKDDKFTSRVYRWLGSNAMQQFTKVVYKTTKAKWHVKKTDTVGDLYNVIIPEVTEQYIVTLEDDVIPPLNGLDILLNKPSDATVYGLAYLSRHGGYAISDKDVFNRVKEKGNGIEKTMAIGGGFTLWNKTAFTEIVRDRPYKGWDDWLCGKIRKDGGNIYVNWDVTCEHLY